MLWHTATFSQQLRTPNFRIHDHSGRVAPCSAARFW